MHRTARLAVFLSAFIVLCYAPAALADGETAPTRDPKQAVDEAYTAKLHQYTTESFFTSPLVDYLPASKTVPTPAVVLGDVAPVPAPVCLAFDLAR